MPLYAAAAAFAYALPFFAAADFLRFRDVAMPTLRLILRCLYAFQPLIAPLLMLLLLPPCC